jgi:hypothetical protein
VFRCPYVAGYFAKSKKVEFEFLPQSQGVEVGMSVSPLPGGKRFQENYSWWFLLFPFMLFSIIYFAFFLLL